MWLRFAWATLAYSVWAIYILEDEDEGWFAWTLVVDLLMAAHAGLVLRRVPGGAGLAVGAVWLATLLGLAATYAWMPRDDTGGLRELVVALGGLFHLLLAAPMASMAARIVRRSQRRYPLEASAGPVKSAG